VKQNYINLGIIGKQTIINNNINVMAIEKIIIENRKLTVYERDLNNSQFVVYNNKI